MTFDDVADLVGASRATLYYYFSGRDDLLGYLLIEHAKAGAQAIEEATSAPVDAASRLRAAVDAMVDHLGHHPGVCAGFLTALGASGRMGDVLRVNETWIIDPLRSLLVEADDAGAVALPDVDDAAYAIVGGVLLGVLGRSMAGADATDAHFRDRLVDQVTRGVLRSG